MVHADLEHAEAASARHARQRQRHAPVVVVGRRRRMRRALARQARCAASPWCRSCRREPVTATMLRVACARAPPRPSALQRRRARRARRSSGSPAAPNAAARASARPPRRPRPSPARRRRSHARRALALDGDEQRRPAAACACRWKRRRRAAGSAPTRRAPPIAATQRRRQGPQRLASCAHASAPERARAPPRGRRTAATRSPTIWPVSWPLPATTSTSPGCSMPRPPSRIASRRSPISLRAGRGRQDRGADRGRVLAARIVVGDDHDVGQLARRSRP